MDGAHIPTIVQTPYRPITPGAVLGRIVALSLGVTVAAVTAWGIPIPNVETVYDVIGWVTVACLAAAFIWPTARIVRYVSVSWVFVALLSRAAWWLIWSHTDYTFQRAMVPAVTYITIVVLTFAVTALAELVEGLRG